MSSKAPGYDAWAAGVRGGPSFRAWQRVAAVDASGGGGGGGGAAGGPVSSLRAAPGGGPGAAMDGGGGVGVVAARGRTNSILKQAVAMTFAPERALIPAARAPPSWWRGDPAAFAAASAAGESRAAKYSEAKYHTSPPGVKRRNGDASCEPARRWGEAGASNGSRGRRPLAATFGDGALLGGERDGAARAAYGAARAAEEERVAARRSEFNATQAIARRAFEVREMAEAARRAREASASLEQARVQERWRESIGDAVARGGEWR